MSDWILNLPVLWMSVVILGAIYLATAGIHLSVTALAVNERARAFKAISPGMLPRSPSFRVAGRVYRGAGLGR
jgi:hypothetical protein